MSVAMTMSMLVLKTDAYNTILLCSQIWNQLRWFVQFNSILSPQWIMSAQVGAENEDLNSSLAV
jgi:hypothetical protein